MIKITDKKSLEDAFAQNFGSPYFPVLGDLYMKEGDLRRAKMVCELGIEHSPGNDCGKFILAKIALTEEKYTIAEKWLKKVANDNPANFNALRILIRLEFYLKRSSKTIIKYILHILKYIPNDVECQDWLLTIKKNSDELPEEKKINAAEDNDNTVSKEELESKPIKNIDYEIERSMATFTMLQVLKSQKHYQQALVVLNMMESKNVDIDRISIERKKIQSILSRDSSA